MGYEFRDERLLQRALTHPSAGKDDNQRLEFLGDAVLQYVVSDALYRAYPMAQEGQLTHLRQLLVCETALSGVAQKLGIGRALRMDKGEELTGGREKPSVLCDAMEAVLAAVYLDGGMQAAVRLVTEHWPKPEDVPLPLQDSKGALQERLQRNGGETPAYRIIAEEGPPNDPVFQAEVTYQGRVLAQGRGRTKRMAEKEAALKALQLLDRQENASTAKNH